MEYYVLISMFGILLNLQEGDVKVIVRLLESGDGDADAAGVAAVVRVTKPAPGNKAAAGDCRRLCDGGAMRGLVGIVENGAPATKESAALALKYGYSFHIKYVIYYV